MIGCFTSFLLLFVIFFDTFSGIGGFALPLTEAGHTCAGFSEIDKHAVQIYRSHFPSHPFYGDITAIDAASLPDFDLLTGGFPCQAFSIAGKRRGFEDTCGTLFFDLCRIAQTKRPRHLLLENVRGLLSHDGGRTFGTILASLDELGYDAQWEVLNSKNFGVPQNRERVFLVGHLRGTPRPQVFPLGHCDGGAAQTFTGGADGSSPNESGVTAPNENQRGRAAVIDHRAVRETDDASQCLDANYWKGPDNHGQRTVIAIRGRNGRAMAEARSDGLCNALRASEGGSGKAMVSEGDRIRRLTPLECERLQGFPDGWTAGVSDTQRYRCLGNAVTVNVVREIIRRFQG